MEVKIKKKIVTDVAKEFLSQAQPIPYQCFPLGVKYRLRLYLKIAYNHSNFSFGFVGQVQLVMLRDSVPSVWVGQFIKWSIYPLPKAMLSVQNLDLILSMRSY